MKCGSRITTSWLRLGRAVIHMDVLCNVKPSELTFGLERHAMGDWGVLPEVIKNCNEFNLLRKKMIVSRFAVASAAFIYIVTDVKWSRTAVMLELMH